MTYSIVAFDPKNKEWGVAVQSKFIAVGAIVPFAEAKVGAIATQAFANTSYGPLGLEMLRKGMSATDVIEALTEYDSHIHSRQIGVVDSKGNTSSFTGKDCFSWAGHIIGKNYCCQGNILVSADVIKEMASAYENTEGDLVEKFFVALDAAQAAGGDKRGQESAAILIVKEKGAYDGGTDRYIDIRVDEHPKPIEELKKVFEVYDLCLLKRDNPKDIVKLEGDILKNVLKVLFKDGFYNNTEEMNYTSEIKEALIKWMHTNNFEVKERKDDFLYGSVYRYMMKMKEK